MNQLEMQWNKMCLLVTITMGQFSSVTGNHQIFIYSRNKHLLLLFFTTDKPLRYSRNPSEGDR